MARGQSKGSERAAELVAAYKRSGATRKAFCAAMGIAVTTLDYYRRRVKSERPRQVGLVPVEVKREAGREPLALMLRGGLRLEIGAGFDEATLRRIVEALGSNVWFGTGDDGVCLDGGGGHAKRLRRARRTLVEGWCSMSWGGIRWSDPSSYIADVGGDGGQRSRAG